MVDTSSFGSYEPIMPLSSSVQKPQEALLFTLSNPAMTVRLTDLGAAIVGIDVPDRDGTFKDVVLGFDDAPSYYPDGQGTYFGATVGPSANRVEGAMVPRARPPRPAVAVRSF